MSSVRGPIGRAGVGIDRRPSAEAHGLDVEGPFQSQVLKDPVEAAAIRLIAECRAHVAAREAVREARQRRADVLRQIAGAAAPGWARRGKRLLFRRSRWRGRLWRDESRRLAHQTGGELFCLKHPHQIESPDLRLMRRLQQLDARPKLLLQPPLALLVLFACHDGDIAAQTGGGRQDRLKARRAGGAWEAALLRSLWPQEYICTMLCAQP